MNAPSQNSPRRRLEALLAIPDSQRSDAEWDELIELEISLAPGNRQGAPDPSIQRRPQPAGPRQPRPVDPTQPKKPFRKFRKRTPKPAPG